MTQEGTIANTVWQAAKVRKPLMAVSACEDKGNVVVFDKGASCILSGTNPEIAEIRRLIRQATRKVKVDRTGGTYTFRMWRVPKDFNKPEGFQGPVKR